MGIRAMPDSCIFPTKCLCGAFKQTMYLPLILLFYKKDTVIIAWG